MTGNRQAVRGLALAAVLLVALVVVRLSSGGSGTDGSASDPAATGTSSSSSSSSSSAPSGTATPGGTDPESGLPWIAEADLPTEARDTLALIDRGGPFPYPGKDGSTFGNFEGLLPDRDRGYYAEYTVPTPGSSDRGARRIIAGEGGELYWTADHYESFERIARGSP